MSHVIWMERLRPLVATLVSGNEWLEYLIKCIGGAVPIRRLFQVIWDVARSMVLVTAVSSLACAQPASVDSPRKEPAAKGQLLIAPAAEAYLRRITDSISKYNFSSQAEDIRGTVTVRFTIARDGKLIDVSIARSSGKPALDSRTLEAFRAMAPYPPLPPEITGESVAFTMAFEAGPAPSSGRAK